METMELIMQFLMYLLVILVTLFAIGGGLYMVVIIPIVDKIRRVNYFRKINKK